MSTQKLAPWQLFERLPRSATSSLSRYLALTALYWIVIMTAAYLLFFDSFERFLPVALISLFFSLVVQIGRYQAHKGKG